MLGENLIIDLNSFKSFFRRGSSLFHVLQLFLKNIRLLQKRITSFDGKGNLIEKESFSCQEMILNTEIYINLSGFIF